MTGERIGFRPLTEKDYSLLHRWLAVPEVRRWWAPDSAPFSFDDVVGKYGRRIRGDSPVQSFVVILADRPIGYIQRYPIEAYPDYARAIGAEPGWVGIDFFIGEPDLIGKGIGPRMISAFVREHLRVDPEVTACVSGPDPRNARSIATLERVGFRPLRRVQVPGTGTEEQVMVLRRRGDHGAEPASDRVAP